MAVRGANVSQTVLLLTVVFVCLCLPACEPQLCGSQGV